MKITDLKCTVLGQTPVVRVTTDEGISGLGPVESYKPYIKPHVLFYKDLIVGEDPTNVERVMQRIRRMASFKPWGSAVSAIEIALWDIAGKAAGLPIYKLLGGKVRDRVRVYNGAVRFPMNGYSPEDYAENMARMKAAPEGFTIIKQGIGFHSPMPREVPDFFYGEFRGGGRHPNRGLLTERGLKHVIACVEAMKDVLGDEVGLALDCGPGWTVPDAIRLAKALEPLNVMWLEDLITGDYTPYVLADLYRDVTQSTSTPIHTGEQIYLRQNFMDLIEKRAVDIIGPDPCDVGGLAELKWVAEYADLHGILMAPHGTGDGLIGLAALVQVAATLPDNYIAFEYPVGNPPWWYDIVEGLPNPIVKDGFIEVWDRPGLGVDINPEAARPYLPPGDEDFFD
ncbi:mandelate racemase/muconate lactonizing enzyme family protein [Litorilinea aerophila]|uniref:Mandelate racemase/muconate lactonizing enzyme family protein n=1 Tax=Litorilinea aerophila TaxID=1204385 RepID=A0A540VG80_9CHLR|nr:mandelate racemase/muconate lactonizing enzyme family protein [Litorilinea aerophila]MCC9076456.1 mandelate racemase/muconate lactonizing enzyme family protein [Litorilinea aerophila]GIV79635.1 MAG: mandelate racemase [Litorilinea sp.]